MPGSRSESGNLVGNMLVPRLCAVLSETSSSVFFLFHSLKRFLLHSLKRLNHLKKGVNIEQEIACQSALPL